MTNSPPPVDNRSQSYLDIAKKDAAAREAAAKKKAEEQAKTQVNIDPSKLVYGQNGGKTQVAIEGKATNDPNTTNVVFSSSPSQVQSTTPTAQPPVNPLIKAVFQGQVSAADVLSGKAVDARNVSISGRLASKLAREGTNPQSIRDDVIYNARGIVRNDKSYQPISQQKPTNNIQSTNPITGELRAAPQPNNIPDKLKQKGLELAYQAQQKKGFEKQILASESVGLSFISGASRPIFQPYNFFIKEPLNFFKSLATNPAETLQATQENIAGNIQSNPINFFAELGGQSATIEFLPKIAKIGASKTYDFILNKKTPVAVEAEAGISSTIDYGQNIAFLEPNDAKIFSNIAIEKNKGLYKIGTDFYEVSGRTKSKGLILDETTQISKGLSELEISKIEYGVGGKKITLQTTPANVASDTIFIQTGDETASVVGLGKIELQNKQPVFKLITAKTTKSGDVTSGLGASFITSEDLADIKPESIFRSTSENIATITDSTDSGLPFTKSINKNRILALRAKEALSSLDFKPSKEQLKALKLFKSTNAGSEGTILSFKQNNIYSNLDNGFIVKEVFKQEKNQRFNANADQIQKGVSVTGKVGLIPKLNKPSVSNAQSQNGLNQINEVAYLPKTKVFYEPFSQTPFQSLSGLSSRRSILVTSKSKQLTPQTNKQENDLSLLNKNQPIQDIGQLQLQKQAQAQELIPRTSQIQILKPKQLLTPRQLMNIQPKTSTETPFINFKKQKEFFGVEVRRRGKFKPIASGVSLPEAIKLGKSKVQNTLAATLRFTSRGQPINVNADLGKQFYKKNDMFIQKADARLGSRGEVGEIFGYKNAAPKKKKNKRGSSFLI